MKLAVALGVFIFIAVGIAIFWALSNFFNANPPEWAKYMLVSLMLWGLVTK